MSSEAEGNKAIVRRFLVEHMAKGNLDVIDELLSPDFVDRSLMRPRLDREGYKRSVAEMIAPFSDLSITIDEQVAEGDKVTTWYTGISTHDRGPFMGVAPPAGGTPSRTLCTTASWGARLWRSEAGLTF